MVLAFENIGQNVILHRGMIKYGYCNVLCPNEVPSRKHLSLAVFGDHEAATANKHSQLLVDVLALGALFSPLVPDR